MEPDLPRRYAQALETHLQRPDEASLATAYELGRGTLGAGGTLLDVAAVHHHALAGLAAAGALDAQRVEAASAFFSEALSPFEMATRGFRETNASLRSRNAELVAAQTQLEAVNRE